MDTRLPPLARATTLSDAFSRFASWSADLLGSAGAFVLSTLLTLLWALSGPFFNYSDTWQLVINTATTVLTFLAVLLIQHTQNREGRALQLKLDELIRASKDVRIRLIDWIIAPGTRVAEGAGANGPPNGPSKHSMGA